MKRSRPPAAYQDFVRRFPRLGQAWALANDEAARGPLDVRAQRLAKLAIAIGAQRESAARSAVRKALEEGVRLAEMEQLVPLAAPLIGFPASVAALGWIRETAPAAGAASSPARKRRRAR